MNSKNFFPNSKRALRLHLLPFFLVFVAVSISLRRFASVISFKLRGKCKLAKGRDKQDRLSPRTYQYIRLLFEGASMLATSSCDSLNHRCMIETGSDEKRHTHIYTVYYVYTLSSAKLSSAMVSKNGEEQKQTEGKKRETFLFSLSC